MRLKVDQLTASLKQGLKAVYLISGDEPLQLGEAADEIRQAAKKAGFLREVISIETGHEWPLLQQQSESLSIFSEQKLIDLRVNSGKLGVEGSKALQLFCQKPSEDTILLISMDKLDASAQKSHWFQDVDKRGVIVQVWPIQAAEMQDWLMRRAARKGMRLEPEAVKMLVTRLEGNLLAAAQEIEKLYVLHGSDRIDKQDIDDQVAISARYDVFKLSEAILQGKLARSLKILDSLRSDQVAAPVVLWAISREIRLLMALRGSAQHASIYKKTHAPERHKALLESALSRLKMADLQSALQLCADTDLQIKGEMPGDCWETLLSICCLLSKSNTFANYPGMSSH